MLLRQQSGNKQILYTRRLRQVLAIRQLVHFLRVVPVDLVLNGHAHRLEYLRTGDTGHADLNINWIVVAGFSLRQRPEGANGVWVQRV